MPKTQLITVSKVPLRNEIELAARCLKEGGLVGMPTETVYGLAANAYIPDSIRRVFEVKGRPQDNPLIVHLANCEQLPDVVSQVPEIFDTLYRAFCPGPLTMIMMRSAKIPAEISAGLDTVAVRFPDCAPAVMLIELSGVPVVAPSGNLSGKPSPTLASHMLGDLEGKIDYILDYGATEIGVESTVLDITGEIPVILRPGAITAEMIYQKTGIKVSDYTVPEVEGAAEFVPRSPGMKYRHYAPSAQVQIARGADSRERALAMAEMYKSISSEGRTMAVFASAETVGLLTQAVVTDEGRELSTYTYPGASEPARATHDLFAALRYLDNKKVDIIVVEELHGDGASAYMNRLERAAAPR